jgi:membrane protease YdiL (CAAX protease family)
MLDHWIFAPIPAVAELIHNAESGSARPSAWQGLLASFYGAVTEEILMRLGLLSLLALALRTLARMGGASRELALPTDVFWAANIVTAVLFGLGHLPATAALAPLSGAPGCPGRCTKRDCWPRVWRIVQALRVGMGDDLAFWRRYCRACRRRRLEAHWYA